MEKTKETHKNKYNPVPEKKRKLWFKGLKSIMKMRYKRPAFVHLGEPFEYGSLILSNHEGTDAPMAFEIYHPHPIRMWGAYEMNSGLKKMYVYQTKVYYHEKKHWNLHLARLFCLLASPLTNMFYSGFNLISTYKDARLMTTMKESVSALQNGESVVIFPEDSTNGYLAELEGFHAGFVTLADICLKKGIDVPIYVSYLKKKEGVYVIDNPIKYSELKKQFPKKEELINHLVNRCNELGKMTFDEEFIKKTKEQNKLDFKKYKEKQTKKH